MLHNGFMSFDTYVRGIEDLFWKNGGGAHGSLKPLKDLIPDVPKSILILAPHPDDECLMAGVALRAIKEFGSKVTVVPFSYGSKTDRQFARKGELLLACKALGFDFFDPRGPDQKELTPVELDQTFNQVRPSAMILPHAQDGHPAHIRASLMGKDCATQFKSRTQQPFTLFYSEFWQSMEAPNLSVPLDTDTVIQMGEALLKHQGEITRNPYHLFLPAYLMDQQRRGSEMSTQAGATPKIESPFAQIYRREVI